VSRLPPSRPAPLPPPSSRPPDFVALRPPLVVAVCGSALECEAAPGVAVVADLEAVVVFAVGVAVFADFEAAVVFAAGVGLELETVLV